MYFRLFLISILVTLIRCQKLKKSGEEIADALYRHPKECKDPNDGGIWAPLAAGHSCGSKQCKYPDQWCSAKSSAKSVPQFSCVNLPEECKKALQKEESNITTTTKSSISKSTPSKSTPITSTSIPESTTEKPTIAPESEENEKSAETPPPSDTSKSSEEEPEVTNNKKPKQKGEAKPRKGHESDEENEGGAGAEVKPAPAPQKPVENCRDGHPLCCFWASNSQPLGSECHRNAAWMRTTCQKSCGTCGCRAPSFQSCQVNVNVDGCPYSANNPSFVAVPLANRGGGVFAFPTSGGNPNPVAVPVGNGFQASPFARPSGPSPVLIPIGNRGGFQQQRRFAFAGNQQQRSPVLVRVGGKRK